MLHGIQYCMVCKLYGRCMCQSEPRDFLPCLETKTFAPCQREPCTGGIEDVRPGAQELLQRIDQELPQTSSCTPPDQLCRGTPRTSSAISAQGSFLWRGHGEDTGRDGAVFERHKAWASTRTHGEKSTRDNLTEGWCCAYICGYSTFMSIFGASVRARAIQDLSGKYSNHINPRKSFEHTQSPKSHEFNEKSYEIWRYLKK